MENETKDRYYSGEAWINDDTIKVWPFGFAPKELQELSDHGGDEDWLAVVPKHLVNLYEQIGGIRWLQSGGPFGVCDVTEHILPNGDVVYIGAHS